MSDATPMQCPKCGGRQEKDLRHMRRITGWTVILTGLGALVALALVDWRAPVWLLVICVVVMLLGVVALWGAAAARYCVKCEVRLEAMPVDKD